jgi:DNA polymerase-3 subunit delta'
MTALPPWGARQLRELVARRGHAWLLHGPSGLGQYPLGLELARAWLCSEASQDGACGRCASCHQVDARVHPDLFVLLPEITALALGWPLDESAQEDIDSKKRKPSREIRVDAAREMVGFTQLTRSAGACKVVLVFPAERMNQVTANTILKTLEEPPGETRFILCCDAAHQLLPTIRSRCQQFALGWPPEPEALEWLAGQGVGHDEAGLLLAIAGGRPELALGYSAAGRDGTFWRQLPRAMARGEAAVFANWTIADVVDALQKLCHDQMAHCCGAAPRYFPLAVLSNKARIMALKQWSVELMQSARIVEHPLNPGLMLETLVWHARNALNSPG